MKSTMKLYGLTLACFLSFSSNIAWAGGFYIPEQSASSAGKSGAYTADARDPSAIAFNPAGLSQLDSAQISLGLSLVAPKSSFKSNIETQTLTADKKSFPIPSLFAATPLGESYALGIGISAPFGLGIAWPKDSIGRFSIISQELSTFFFTPTVAVDASGYLPGLSFGAGVDFVIASMNVKRALALGEYEGSAELGMDGSSVGARMGLLWRPPKFSALRLGLCYRSQVGLYLQGRGDLDVAEGVPRSVLPADGPISARLTLPTSILAGVALTLGSHFELELDANWFDWSVFDKLVVVMPDKSKIITQQDWHDTVAIRAGLTMWFGPLSVRAGAALDPSPIPAEQLDFGLPEGNRKVLSGGAGFKLPYGLIIDGAISYVLPSERETLAYKLRPTPEGSFSTSAYVISANLTWIFGNQPEETGTPETSGPKAK